MDVAGHAGHAHASQRLDARLLQRIEGGTRFGLGRRALAVDIGIVAREPHRHGVALATSDGNVTTRRQARQVGEPRLVGVSSGRSAEKLTSRSGLPATARTVAPMAVLNAWVVSGLLALLRVG